MSLAAVPDQPPPAPAEAVAGAEDPGSLDALAVLGSAGRLARSLPELSRAGLRLAAEFTRIATGTSTVAPSRGDWRFTDPTWTENATYHRLMQGYLAWSDALTRLVEDADLPDWRERERLRFLLRVLTSAAAPTNVLAGNPAAMKRTLETGGANLWRGFAHWLTDLAENGGLPAQVDRSRFTVGRNLAATPGAVVYRDEVLELLQYRPSTPQVRARPFLMVPPQINKYYIMDLAPGRSMVEYAVSRGIQTFAISWRNPGREHGSWTLDTYARSILAALDAAREITGSRDVNVFGLCAGGITLATVLNHLAATDDDRAHSASFGVTLLDWSDPAPIGAFSSSVDTARRIGRSGVFPGRSMAATLAWMRPNDLIWNYWVNNYLMGNEPKPFDILAWNNDATNLPAALHGQFLDVFTRNSVARPGRLTVLGSPVDLSRVRLETFVTGGLTDHITPWRGCYRSTQLFGGPSQFVLTSSGHVQTLVSPVDSPGDSARARHWIGPRPGPDPDAWRAASEERTGSWWRTWMDWVTERSGLERPAPARLGSSAHPPQEDAPGTYVHARA